MRVLFNTLCTVHPDTEPARYVARLLPQLERLRPGSIHSHPTEWAKGMYRWWQGQSQDYEALARTPGLVARVRKHLRGKLLAVVRKTLLPDLPLAFIRAAAGQGCDVYHEPNNLPAVCDLPTVATVHDPSVLTHPEWHDPSWVDLLERHLETQLKRCAHLFVVSGAAKRQVVRLFGLSARKVSVTPPGLRGDLRPILGEELTERLAVLQLREGYLLHVGPLEPRSNPLVVLRAYCDLPAALREKHPLYLVGPQGRQAEEIFAYLDSVARHHNVHWLGPVGDAHLPALYCGARGLLVPSRDDPTGRTALEMMACGGAVLASRTDALAEVTGGQFPLIDPDDQGGWRDAILRLLRDREWRISLKGRGRPLAAAYTWERCAERTLAGYDQAAGRAREAAPAQRAERAA